LGSIGAIVTGMILLAVVLQDVFEVLLLPRRIRRRLRLSSVYFKFTWMSWRRLGLLVPPSDARSSFLSTYGPLSVVALFTTWSVMLIIAFALCQWGFNDALAQPPDFATDLYLSGSTFFTLGFGDIVPHTTAGRVFCVVEAGSGFGLIAGVIGYLPVLYQLFSRREAHIIQLDARAGSPPSALVLLSGRASGQTMDSLDDFLRTWEVWGAELLESHLSYPMLMFYRSQHDNQSWLAALATIMDASALILCGLKDTRTYQAKMTFAMGRLVILEMSTVLQLTTEHLEMERRMSDRKFDLASVLKEAGIEPAQADIVQRLDDFRATYEPFLIVLSDFLLLDLPDWLPTDAPDNWQSSVHGTLATQLLKEAPSDPG
jgi:hypothetical protein